MRLPAAHGSTVRAGALVLTVLLGAGCATRSSQPDLPPANGGPPPEETRDKSYVVPVVEIVLMNSLVNLAGRRIANPADFEVSLSSIRRNLTGGWVVEDDPFEVNQVLHPYQGAMYHDIARSSGLGYWQSAAYTFAGSALWEIAGETTRPSKNDQIASGIAGSFLGEPLFRTARLLLDRGTGRPGFWRTLGAAIVSPPVGVNQAVFGDRFDPDRSDHLPATDVRIELGAVATITGARPAVSALDFSSQFAGFSVDYGEPGPTAGRHAHAFDYFRLEGAANRDRLESLASRGLVAGRDVIAGPARGVWGLYGNFDYFAADVFRISSTAVALGSTLHADAPGITLQATGLAGLGYTAVNTGTEVDGDYHYGVAPQALANVRVIAGRRAALDVTARQYRVSDIAAFGTRQRDVVLRGDASLALRLFGPHGAAVRYTISRRDATDPARLPLTQTRTTLGVFYTFLGSRGFGSAR